MAMSVSSLASFLSSLLPSKSPTPLPPPPPSLPATLHLPGEPSHGWVPLVATWGPTRSNYSSTTRDVAPIAFPALAHSNIRFFKSTYNVQVFVKENEPEEKLLNRFRREVLKAGVIQECKRRRFFENKQDKKKRKTREAARRNRKRRPQPRALKHSKQETPRKKEISEEDDNWEDYEVDLPYC